MTLPQILVIEDDPDLQSYLKSFLTENNFSVKTASTASLALKLIEQNEPDLVIMDLVLPDMPGESLCGQIRQQYQKLPIIMLTAKTSVAEKIRGLNLGADDYLTKPFTPEELLARLKSQLRGSLREERILKVADLELNTQKIEAKRAEKLIKLSPREFKFLEYLMNNKGVVLSREMILNRVWLYSPEIETRVVDVYIGYLRKKIDTGHKKKLIHSIRGFGYMLRE